MADDMRSAKSGSSWTTNDLVGFNITVVDDNLATFFGNPNLPASTVDQTILNNVGLPAEPVAEQTRLFFWYLRYMMEPGQSADGAFKDFALHLLRLLEYDRNNRGIQLRPEIGFIMCGQRVDATADMCVRGDHPCTTA